MEMQSREIAELQDSLREFEDRLNLLEGKTGNPDFNGALLRNARVEALIRSSQPTPAGSSVPSVSPGVRQNPVTGDWEYSPDGVNWYPMTTVGEIDTLYSQVGAGSTLHLYDDGVNQFFEGNLGDRYNLQAGADHFFGDAATQSSRISEGGLVDPFHLAFANIHYGFLNNHAASDVLLGATNIGGGYFGYLSLGTPLVTNWVMLVDDVGIAGPFPGSINVLDATIAPLFYAGGPAGDLYAAGDGDIDGDLDVGGDAVVTGSTTSPFVFAGNSGDVLGGTVPFTIYHLFDNTAAPGFYSGFQANVALRSLVADGDSVASSITGTVFYSSDAGSDTNLSLIRGAYFQGEHIGSGNITTIVEGGQFRSTIYGVTAGNSTFGSAGTFLVTNENGATGQFTDAANVWIYDDAAVPSIAGIHAGVWIDAFTTGANPWGIYNDMDSLMRNDKAWCFRDGTHYIYSDAANNLKSVVPAGGIHKWDIGGTYYAFIGSPRTYLSTGDPGGVHMELDPNIVADAGALGNMQCGIAGPVAARNVVTWMPVTDNAANVYYVPLFQ